MSSPLPPSTVVADTDIVSFIFKSDTRAYPFRSYLNRHRPAISFMTVAELRRWELERKWGERRRNDLEIFLRQFAVYQSTEEVCRWWSAVMVGARQNGRRIEVADAWIAATALLYGVPLITHNP